MPRSMTAFLKIAPKSALMHSHLPAMLLSLAYVYKEDAMRDKTPP